MKYLNLLLSTLKSNKTKSPYIIPDSWNINSTPSSPVDSRSGEISVDAYDYFISAIESIISLPAESINNDLNNFIVYSMLPGTQTAWQHYDSTINNGSFLKCISILPLLKQMNVDIVYLLPVFRGSDLFKKGEKSSPYSIKDIMSIDPNLHDEHLNGISVEDEFCAFVEACHHLGMRVMMDFVFRTAARDSILLLEHPDWFYWIKADRADTIAAPNVEGIGHQSVDKRNVPMLYNSSDMPSFIDNFVYPPTSEQWSDIISDCFDDSSKALLKITDKYGICTMTGFADTINDPQPPWTDVTYLKFYFDNSPYSSSVGSDLPPFIAQDGIKCSHFPGNQPNHELWEYIKGVIPHYIKMGIDGARIDMGHALPTELSNAITETAKSMKPDFFFWSEQFDPSNAQIAKNEGSSFITGDMLFMWKQKTPCMRSLSLKNCINAPLPFTSCCETADTPRASLMLSNIKNVKAAIYSCALIPNSLFFINSGLELDEIQPMNLGLLNDESGRFVLPEDHPMYGKLAFFDNVVFDWTRLSSSSGFEWIKNASSLRKKYSHLIKKEFFNEQLFYKRGSLQIIQYSDGKQRLTAFINHSAKSINLNAKLKDKKYSGHFLPELCEKTIIPQGDIYICEENL